MPDVAAIVFLAYYRTGLNMVAFDSQARPIDQPAYVRMGRLRKFLAGALWPRAGWLNREFGWHFVNFLSNLIVMGLGYWGAGYLVESTFLRLLGVWIICITPIGSALGALVSVPLWALLAKPFGLRVPRSVERQFGQRESPREVQLALDALEEIGTELSQTGVYAGVALAEVKPLVIELINDEEKTVASVSADGLAPKTLVYLLLANTIRPLLASGRYHVYRGVLSGAGQGLLAIWNRANDELEAAGFLPPGEVRDDRQWMHSAIKEAG